MPRKITLVNHLSLEQLNEGWTKAKTMSEKSRWQIVMLFVGGKQVFEIAEIVGMRKNWIYIVLRAYNQEGQAALRDKRELGTGVKPLLDQAQLDELNETLNQPPPDGGVWTGPKVAAWLTEHHKRKFYDQRGWEYLRKTHTLRIPRRQHIKGDIIKQEEFKKNFQNK